MIYVSLATNLNAKFLPMCGNERTLAAKRSIINAWYMIPMLAYPVLNRKPVLEIATAVNHVKTIILAPHLENLDQH